MPRRLACHMPCPESGAASHGSMVPHPALSAELAGRNFILKTFEKLGLHFEPIKPMGRPPKTYGA
jgi:hypothetical protein